MSRTRRRALLATVALGASLLAVAPATAADAASTVSKPGTKVRLLRSDITRAPGSSAARAQRLTVVPGAAATPRSTWNVTYSGFTPQAQSAFQAAVNIWAGIVASSVPITVAADFTDLGPGVLGYAGPHAIVPIAGSGDGTSWYPVALANALKGSDQVTPHSGESGVDIEASFSSTEQGIYYGTDSNPPAGYVDFESIVLHELGHGLGFTGSADYASGVGHYESPRFVFDYFNVSGVTGGQRLISLPNNSAALGNAFTSASAYWDGAQAKAANGGNRVKLYAPDPWEVGSSIAHLDEVAFPQGDPNSLETPYVGNQEVIHSPGPIMVGMMKDMGWNAVLQPPDAPPGVTGEPNNGSVDVAWNPASPNGSPVTTYTVKAYDSSDTALATALSTASVSGSTTHALISGLDNAKSYVFTVSASNAYGTGPVSATRPVQPVADVTAPTVTVTSPHVSGLGKAVGGTFTFAGADAGHANPILTYTCSVDAVAASACSSPTASPAFTDGTSHTFTVIAKDASGNTSAPTTVTFVADGVLPTISNPVLPTYTLASVIGTPTASVADANGVKNLDFRYRRAAFSGAFGALTYPAAWQAAATLKESLPAVQGYTYCFSSRARDRAGNESAWSTERCTATGLDDRGLVAGAGWVREVYAKHFLSTDTKTSTAGATLTRTGVSALRLSLVAVKCAKCGVVGVYFNGRLIKNVNLKQAATAYQTIFPIISFPSIQTGTVVIKPLTKGAVNYIDGLVISRV